MDIFIWLLFMVKYFHLLGYPTKKFNNKLFLRSNFCSIAHKLNAWLYLTMYCCNMYFAQAHTRNEDQVSLWVGFMEALYFLSETIENKRIWYQITPSAKFAIQLTIGKSQQTYWYLSDVPRASLTNLYSNLLTNLYDM